jgi:type IV pilus assembly protein PilY1
VLAPAALLTAIAVTHASTSGPLMSLTADPPFAASTSDTPTIALALSVEFPTVGAQYVGGGSVDATYSNANEYLGYYDAEACYRYIDAPAETPPSGMAQPDLKRFDRIGAAASRMCADAFSGNFLNWASNSAVDMLRLALSGGDRYVDTANLTILQRAIVPNGDPICMWNTGNFPAKRVQRNGGGTNAYWGAVPQAMITSAGGNDIWVANTLNRIYFKAGSSASGSCGSTSDYRLTASGSTIGPITGNPFSTPANAVAQFGGTQCASEGGTCSFNGKMEVLYGAPATSGRAGGWITFLASNGAACSNTVTGVTVDPASGVPKICYVRPYTGSNTWTPTLTANSLNSDGYFYSRVQVCDVNGAGVLQDVRNYGSSVTFCRQYPNGKYKPTGAIQKYSEQLRLAAFGYVMDQTASYNSGGRYGGVLRAPMKYVGAKTFDENGIDNTPSGGNPAREWDTATGIFHANPDGDITQAKPISGVINYLNQFGRTGPVPGRYKRYDPVGELHYEVLRYLQGLQPSADAIIGLGTVSALHDGFPLFTNWSDPYGGSRTNASDYSCLKSNIVVIGDINTHDGNRLPAPSAAANVPDINYWRGIVQAFEKNFSTTYLDGQGATRSTANPNGSNGNVPSASSTSQILGSAYWAHTHDIRGAGWTNAPALQRPGLRVKTFLFDVNENGSQNDANTRRYANQFFMAAKYGGFETQQPLNASNTYNTKGNPFQTETGVNDNDVWQKPLDPGEASTYYLQSSARGVLNAFEDIFGRASTAARSIASRPVSSRDLSDGQKGSLSFEALFNTLDWSGDVKAFDISAPNGVLTVDPKEVWSASTELSKRDQISNPRNIVVGHAGETSTPKAISFTWAAVNGSTDTTIRNALNRPAAGSPDDNLAQDRLAFLRGDTRKDGTTFRPRNNKLLGDIVNSGVAYSGAPSRSISGGNYATFASNNATRTAAVFVGANDGMLHAFNATNGTELFAYIPSWLVPNLALLSSKTYVNSHKAFVDATPAVGEANLGTPTTADWRTVLVGGTGAGGKGVYALDVTNPAAFNTASVLWEFTNNDDADMGHVTGTPRIVKLRTNAPSATSATYKWFALVPGGVNGSNPSIFVLDLSKPAGTAWKLDSNYYKITLPVDATLSTTLSSGVTQLTAEIGTAGEAVRVYAGDLHGRLWRLEFRQAGTADWNMAKLTAFSTSYGSDGLPTGTPLPLYIATNTLGQVQPITMAPSVLYGGSVSTNIIAFGTGKLMEATDKTSTTAQSFYALYDNIATAAQGKDTSNASNAIILGRARLKVGTVNTSTRTISVDAFKWGRRTDRDVSDSTSIYSGWAFDFPDSGEREIYGAVVNGTNLAFNTLLPLNTTAAACASSGRSNSYYVDILTGDGGYRASPEPLSEPSFVITNVEYATQGGFRRGMTTNSAGRGVRRITTAEVGTGRTEDQSVSIGRLSWRRINNYLDLHNEAIKGP